MTSTEKSSTRPLDQSGSPRWDRVLWYISLAVVAALVLGGITGLLGVRTATASETASGFTLEVEYAVMTRPGLATPLDLRVSTNDGSPLPGEVTTRLASSYLAMFDENGLDPQPSSSFQSDRWTWWTFEVPDGEDVLEVSFDARLEPSVQWGESSMAALEIDGEQVVAVRFATRVAP